MLAALALNSPIVRMCLRMPASPSLSIASGVLASAKSVLVALFTPTSVAWADSTTATSSSNGEP